MIPYARQNVDGADIEAVARVLSSDFLTQGPAVQSFEEAVASYCGARYAVAANSGTSALHVACLALGLKRGDTLWTSAITFAASANVALHCGANVDFVDIDPQSYNLCPKRLDEKLQQTQQSGKLPKILIAVHMAGQAADMDALAAVCRRYDIRIIEDAAHAIGATFQGAKVGSCEYSDITVFSFHPVKTITCGEGGVAVSNDAELASKMRQYCSHGMVRDTHLLDHDDQGAWYYEQQVLGYNFRLSDIHAALGLSQLRKLDVFVNQRNALAERYHRLLQHLPLTTPHIANDRRSAFHLYVVRLYQTSGKPTRRVVFDAMRALGIGVHVHYIPVYRHPYYRRQLESEIHCPNAEAYYENALTLPLYPALSHDQQDGIASTLTRVLGEQTKAMIR